MKKHFLLIHIFIVAMMSGFIQADSTPTMSRVYGNQYTQGVADSQDAAQVGTLDGTFGSGGILSVDGILTGGKAVAIETLSNGDYLVVVANPGIDYPVVAMYNAEGVLQTSYGSSGIVTLNMVTANSNTFTTMLDAQGRLLVAGGPNFGTAGWIVRINQDGSVVTQFVTGTAWQNVGGLAQQASGQIIAAGFDGINAMLARYNLDGSLDTTFGSSGFVVVNGAGSLPNSTHGLYSVAVYAGSDLDLIDNIYVLMLNNAGPGAAYMLQLDAAGAWVGTYDTTSSGYLNSASEGEFKLAFDQSENLILAATVSDQMKVTALTASGTSVGGWTDFTTGSGSLNSTYALTNIITSSGSTNGYIYLLGSDINVAVKDMIIIRLTATGELDTTAFNASNGFSLFNAGGVSRTASYIMAAGIAPDGSLYLPGYETTSGVTTPYVTRMNNTPYVYEIAQFPAAQEQGILDGTFGSSSRQTYAGVTSPFNGQYGPSLMQTPQSIMEILSTSGAAEGIPAVGDILVAMNGSTDDSTNASMMFSWLTATGEIDTTVNAAGDYPGYLTLNNESEGFPEYVTSVVQGPAGVVFVSGYTGTEIYPFLRALTTTSTSSWTSGDSQWNVGYQGGSYTAYRGIAAGYLAYRQDALLFVDQNDGTGAVYAYSLGGSLDTAWANNGLLDAASIGESYFNPGPCYGGLATIPDNLVLAYVDADDGLVKVASVLPNGSSLNQNFGDSATPGVTVALFNGATGIDAANVRVCFNSDDNIVVAAVSGDGLSLLFTLLHYENGQIETQNFGTDGVLSVAIDGATALHLKNIAGVSDGTAVVNFWDAATDDTMYLARINLIGELDTTFNSQGDQPGVLPMQIGDKVENYDARVVSGAIIQSAQGDNQGNIVMAGYESVTAEDATPMVLRSFGDLGSTEIQPFPIIDESTAGTFDNAYDLNTLLGAGAGSATVIYVYPSRNAHQGYMLVGYDNGTSSKIARIDVSNQTLDTTFAGGSGIYTISGLAGISCLTIDAQDNIIVGGSNSGSIWAQQIAENGTDAGIAFDFSSLDSVLASKDDSFVGVGAIEQQTSGRYIVSCITDSSYFTLVAFQDKLVGENSALQVDPTFNPEANDGYYNYSGIFGIEDSWSAYNLAINLDDTILVGYMVDSISKLAIAAITADGSGFVSGFNSGAVLVTTMSPDTWENCRLAIDNLNNGSILVATSTDTFTSVQVQRFLSNGATDTSWNSDGSVTTVDNLGSAGVVLSDLMTTTSGQTIFLGYNTAQDGYDHANGPLFACRLDSAGVLDVTWNPNAPLSGSDSDTPGVLTFNAMNGSTDYNVTVMNGSAISISGQILSVGSQPDGTSGDPIVMYIYGDTFVTEIEQAPLEFAAGTLDLTIPGAVSGALDITNWAGVVQKMFCYDNSSNGALMVAYNYDNSSGITLYNADLTLDTNYSQSSYTSDPGAVYFDYPNLHDMHLLQSQTSNTALPIYVTGDDAAGSMWAAQVNADGTVVNYINSDAASVLSTGRVIRQTTNSRVLVAGTQAGTGSMAIAAFISDLSAVDTSFGNQNGTGIYTFGTSGAIYAMAVDSLDRIYIAYNNAGTGVKVQRLLANGTEVDTSFDLELPTAINAYSTTQISMVLDEDNQYLVVAAQDGQSTGNNIRLSRFDISNGSSIGSMSSISVPSKVLNLSDLFMDTSSAENMYVIGYTNSGNSIVARAYSVNSSTIALDTTYAADGTVPGIAVMTIGAMNVVGAGCYNPDRRVYLGGSTASNLENGYLARVYGDIYTHQVAEATVNAAVGAIDVTLQPNNTGAVNLSTQFASGLAGYVAYAVAANPNGDGTAYVAFGDGTNLVVGQVDADMNPVSGFGTSGLTAVQAMDNVKSMTIDADGNIVVAGANSSDLKTIMFDSSGTLLANFVSLDSGYATAVGQQKSGRYIVAAYSEEVSGYIVAYKNTSAISAQTLPVDQTFGPDGDNGFYIIGYIIDDLCIDQDDNIYFVYRNNSNTVCLGKLTANGSGLVDAQNSPATFNNGLIVTTGLSSVSTISPARIAINNDGNIVVGATLANGNIQTQYFDGVTGVPGSVLSVSTSTPAVLARLVGVNENNDTESSNFYGVYYDTDSNVSVFSLNDSGALDAYFGTTSSGLTTVSADDLGLSASVEMYGLSVQFDGKLIAVGSDTPYGRSPALVRFYGYPYVQEFEQAPDQVAAGILDTTLWPTTGAFLLDNTTNSTFNSLLDGYEVRRVFESGNGLMTFVADSGSSTVVFQMNKDLTLNTDFYEQGWREFTSAGGTTGLFVDSASNIYVCGSTEGAWLIGMQSDGSDLSPAFSPSVTMSTGNAVGKQSNGRVISAGQQGSYATLYGYNNTGALDNSFGNGGMVTFNQNAPFTDITIDSLDNIIGVVNVAGDVYLARIAPSGLTVTPLNGGTQITGAVGNVKVVIDEQGLIIVTAATATGFVVRAYFNNATGTDVNPIVINIPNSTGTPAWVLSNIYATDDSKITVVGYDASNDSSTAGQVFVARIESGEGIAIDTTFNTDGTSPSAAGYIVTALGNMDQAFDGIIHADDRIMLVGSNSSASNPYMGRIFGDDYAAYLAQAPVAGVAGTLNPTFGNTNPTTGIYDLSTLDSVLDGGQGRAILPVNDGGYFIAIDQCNSDENSILIKTLADGSLDTTFGDSDGIAFDYAPLGVDALIQDGSGNLVLVGTTSGAGWVQRYTSAGVVDSTFGSSGMISVGTKAESAVEQTLARLVVAGRDASGDVTLFAFQSLSPDGTPGAVDTTFNSAGTVPGQFTITGNGSAPMLIADEYDRLLFAILNGTSVDLYRLTPTGELDITFGTNGIVAGALTSIQNAWDIRLGFDQAGNIVVAGDSTVANTFSVRAFDNGVSTVAGANGSAAYDQSNIAGIVTPNVKALVSDNSSDNYIYLVGKQDSGNGAAWVARINGSGNLDTANFNPEAIDGIAGIFQYLDGSSSAHQYYGIAINTDGTLGMVGSESISYVQTPTVVSIYNTPYVAQEIQFAGAKPVGSVDLTLGVSPTAVTNNGITFFGSAADSAAYGQVARAVGLYNENNIVVAIDGATEWSDGTSNIYINMFDNDGIPNPEFMDNEEIEGTVVAIDIYDNSYAKDMVTFTTANNVTKAIIAGYVYNTALDTTDSLLLQYILGNTPNLADSTVSPQLDSSFGGYDGNPLGVAFGDGNSLYSVARQSTGRIVAAGWSQDDLGLLLGYTSDGKLDPSFGNSGYQSVNTGTSGIYTHAIDTENRINIAYLYNDSEVNQMHVSRFLADGSAVDSSFVQGSVINNIASNSNMKVAVDSSNNVYATAVIYSGGFNNSFEIQSYNQANGDLINSANIDYNAIAGQSDSNYVVGRMIVDAADNVIIAAYDAAHYEIVVMRLVPSYGSSFALDTTFNENGYIKYAVVPSGTSGQTVTDAMIHPDGRILVVGSEYENLP